MSKTYNFGIVGTGMIAGFHAQAIADLPNGQLHSVYSRQEQTANKFASEHHCQAFWDLNKFLSDPRLDVVTICTPSGCHLEPAVAAAGHGKHVLCEKPMEVTLERIDQMIHVHQQAGTKLGGIFNSRYKDVNQLFKQTVESGRLGRITYGAGYVPWWRTQQYYDQGLWRGTMRYDGGGALMNQGTHTVDMVQWLMGPVKRVTAFTGLLGHENLEVEDMVSASLEFESGAIGVLLASTTMYPGLPARVEVAGTAGAVITESDHLKVFKFDKPQDKDSNLIEQFSAPASSGGASDPRDISSENHRRNFACFLEALDKGIDPELDGTEARKAVEIVLAVYKSAKSGRSVDLPL